MPEPLTPQRWANLVAVNYEVNDSTRYREDVELYGKVEFWEVADGQGDCEDYALAKLDRFLEFDDEDATFPRADMRLATCWVEGADGPCTGGYHAVLVVLTSDWGDYVLDNRHTMPMAWDALPYRWDKREVVGEKRWKRIGNG